MRLEEAPVRPATVRPPSLIPGWKWAVVWLMFLATLFNYMDRQTMGSTATYFMREFKLSEKDYGDLEFWFGVAFAIFQFPAGVLADRISLRWLYAGALLIWSASGFATGIVTTFAGLAACRLLLGIGESFNWPCAVAVVRRLLPRESRSMANGIFHAGASIGAAVTPLLVQWIVGPTGEKWRLAFQVTGAAGILWAIVWFSFIRGPRAAEISRPVRDDSERPKELPDHVAPPKPFMDVFLHRYFWITLAVGLAINITWHVYRVWLPRYLVNGLKYTNEDMQWVLTGFYVFADVGCMLAGYVTQRLALTRYSLERARRIVMMATSLLCMLSVPVALLGNTHFFLPIVFLVGAGAMGGFANFYTLSQEISPEHTGKCLGLIGCIIWAVLSPLHHFIGALVDVTHSYVPVFVIIAFIPMIGSLTIFWWKEEMTPAGTPLPATTEVNA